MVYEVEYINGKWWILNDGEIIKSIGGFCETITPAIIKEAIEDEMELEKRNVLRTRIIKGSDTG